MGESFKPYGAEKEAGSVKVLYSNEFTDSTFDFYHASNYTTCTFTFDEEVTTEYTFIPILKRCNSTSKWSQSELQRCACASIMCFPANNAPNFSVSGKTVTSNMYTGLSDDSEYGRASLTWQLVAIPRRCKLTHIDFLPFDFSERRKVA